MRFYQFVKNSNIVDDEINVFRSLNIKLVEERTEHALSLDKIKYIYDDIDKSLNLLEKANRDLRKLYRGKYVFDFCFENEGSMPEEIKIDSKKSEKIKEKWLKLNSELSDIQTNFEKTLQDSLQKGL